MCCGNIAASNQKRSQLINFKKHEQGKNGLPDFGDVGLSDSGDKCLPDTGQ